MYWPLRVCFIFAFVHAAVAVCGNGIVDTPAEGCDDGNTVGGDGCTFDCLIETPCGNFGPTPIIARSLNTRRFYFTSGVNFNFNTITLTGDNWCSSNWPGADLPATSQEVYNDFNTVAISPILFNILNTRQLNCDANAGNEFYDVIRFGIFETNVCWRGWYFSQQPGAAVAEGCSGFCGNYLTLDDFPDSLATFGYTFTSYKGGGLRILCRCNTLPPAAVCGDGNPEFDEPCDDGNTLGGDGCSATCTVEPGWSCSGWPSTCSSICGDGITTGTEECDDGNGFNNDGCTPACTLETGYECTGPSCNPICGDSLIVGSETCDDGNSQDNDGCSSSCQIEQGYTCQGNTSLCAPVCGDGLVTIDEQCDDNNTLAGDGCSAMCAVEIGYACVGSPSVCSIVCGDGNVTVPETCDDGNLQSGDGCASNCTLETGVLCNGEPSSCGPVCGDSLVVLGEQCDDGNSVPGDGCSASCQIETGY